MRGVKTYAQRAHYGSRIELHFLHSAADGRPAIAKPVEFELQESDGEYAPPALSLHRDDAQQLMDALWDAGLRPSEGSGSAGSLAATERHLADMRAIAFGKLEIAKP